MRHRVFKNKKELINTLVGTENVVLDVGFLGQGVRKGSDGWPHALLQKKARDVRGVDLEIDREQFPDTSRYQQSSAESFSFEGTFFDVVFAGDLIEHPLNPGLFLDAVARHMRPESRLVLTTPNCFSLFNMAGKLMNDEPDVNKDHTCYFNHKTLSVLLKKQGFRVEEISYLYSLEYDHKESWKKKFLNVVYKLASLATPKYLETLVVVAVKNDS